MVVIAAAVVDVVNIVDVDVDVATIAVGGMSSCLLVLLKHLHFCFINCLCCIIWAP